MVKQLLFTGTHKWPECVPVFNLAVHCAALYLADTQVPRDALCGQ